MRRIPAQIRRIRAGKPSRGVTTPVSLVYLPVSLTGPGPSGSAEPARLCRGCSHPSRRPPGRAASSFIPPLRRRNNGRSFTKILAGPPRPGPGHDKRTWPNTPPRCSGSQAVNSGRLLYPGDSGVHRPRRLRGRRLPPRNGWSLPPRRCNPARDVAVTRHLQRFPGSRPLGLPRTCGRHGWCSGPWALP